MTDKKARSDQAAHLRQQAEALAHENTVQPPQDPATLGPEDIQKSLHELRVHQIELEVQNEELRHKQAELDESRERYFDLYNLAPVGYVTLSEQGLILEANLTAASMLGVTRHGLVGHLFTRFILEDDQDSYYLHRKQPFPQKTRDDETDAANTPKTQVLELRLLKQGARPAAGNRGAEKDGTPFWAQLETSTVRSASGARLLRVVLSDITERKRGDAELRASEQQYHDMFETNTAVKLLINPDSGAIVRANPAAAAFYGWPVEVLETMNISQVNTLSAEQINVQMTLAASSDRTCFNFSHRLASGEVREVEVHASPMGSGKHKLLFSIIHDITERKQAEAALVESEERFRELLENSLDASYKRNLITQTYDYLSPVFAQITGYSPEEMKALPNEKVQSLTHPDDLAETERVTAESLSGTAGRAYQVEYRFKHKAGAYCWLLDRFRVMRDAAGRPLARIGSVSDITQRKGMEQALQASEEKYRTVADFTYDWEGWRAPDGTTCYVSPSCERISGHTAAEFLADPDLMEKITHPDDRSKVNAHFRAVYQEARDQDLEFDFRILRPSGETRWIGHSCTAVRSEAGRWLGRRFSNRDITERKLAEEASRESEMRFRTLFEHAAVGVALIETKTGRYLDINQKYCDFLGYTREEMLALTLQAVTLPQDVQVNIDNNALLVAEKIREFTMEKRYLRKDGSMVWGLLTGSSLWEPGQEPAVHVHIAVVQDITRHKQMEAALLKEKSLLSQKVEERTTDLRLANTELQHAALIKDEFLASMSHELRTPLTGILGLSEALQMGIYGDLNPKQSQSIENIEKSGRHLLTLINDILDLSKIGAGMIKLDLNILSVREVCQSSMHMIRQLADEKQIKVNLAVEDGVDYLEADARRLKQILVNLLSNAVKFSPAGSDIGLEVKGDVDSQRMTFTVWDHGIGIPIQDLSNLFQVFVQLDSALSRQYGGTGLGLSLVLKMVELHGGGIQVESEPGKGSRFIVTLPWQGGATPPAAILPLPTSSGREAREKTGEPILLIVEDNLLYLNLLADLLTHSGYRVIKARNGEEGIARAREVKPDLILMDIQMPVLDGFQAARQIRTDPDLEKIPIIALTALAMSGDREKCIEAGMNDYLSKPVNIEELKKAMNALL